MWILGYAFYALLLIYDFLFGKHLNKDVQKSSGHPNDDAQEGGGHLEAGQGSVSVCGWRLSKMKDQSRDLICMLAFVTHLLHF